MIQNNWNDLYSGWGLILWFGIVCLLFASIGNWGYRFMLLPGNGDLVAPPQAASSEEMEVPCKL